MAGQASFDTMDYVLLGVMLCGSMGIGLYFSFAGNRQRTKEEYLLGGRRMTAIPVCLSLFATFQSAISLLGTPNEVYTYGTMCAYDIVATSLANLIAIGTVVPLIYPLRITSVNEYLALRYDSTCVQIVGALVGILSSLSYMTIALLSPALALEPTVGVPLWMSIVIVGGVGTIYTTLGGIKSVIWTDVFQTVFIFAGAFTVLVKGVMNVGGIEEVLSIANATGRITFDEINFDPRVRHTVWGITIGGTLYWYSSFYTQSSVQRILSTRSERSVRHVYLFSIILYTVYISVLVSTGLLLTAYFYKTKCDPIAAGFLTNNNQLVPYFVLLTLGFLPGLSGLYISTIFSASLSTLSSGINGLAANTVEDFVSKFLRGKSESFMTSITKFLVCFYGVVCIGLAYLAKELQGPVTQMTFMAVGATSGPLLGIFLLGASFPQANYIGALVGCAAGVMVCFGQAIGAFKYGNPPTSLPSGPTDQCFLENATSSFTNYSIFLTAQPENATSLTTMPPEIEVRDFSVFDISYIWNPLLGVLFTIVVGLLTSLVTNRLMSHRPRPQARFLFRFCRRFWYPDINTQDTDIELD
ncbi:hypothetical protein EGW08_004204 [Elysia chlorotica]|uniref:Sodium-coupled monocarboxylate transporter 1 n=1 Tax=Elysia chlorotica TaxID=188477 RepID=A0A3S1BNY0_ELYCH|nr:hypothetical protein EGW08_004204 [Elysia chlorotica]